MSRLFAPFVLLAAASGCGPPAAGASGPLTPAAVEAATAPVERIEAPRRVRVTGTLLGDEETTVAAKVAGRIVEVLKDLGDAVRPGDPLVRVDPVDYRLALEERARAFAQTLARLGVTELPPAGFDPSKLPALVRAGLRAENAKARYERGRQLSERTPPLISQQDFADLRTAWEVAESDIRVERLLAESTLAEARTLEAQVHIAEQRLKDTVHRTPEAESSRPEDARAESPSYQVAHRSVSVGDFVQVGAPLFRLVDANPVKMRAAVPERLIGRILPGRGARVRVDAFPAPFDGEVARVSPAVDVQTRTFAVEIRVPNPDGRLKPGSFATADIDVGTEKILAAPESALVSFAGVHRVFRVKDGKAEERRVVLGERLDGRIEIKAGLEEGDAVVLKPSPTLRSGTPIQPAGKAR